MDEAAAGAVGAGACRCKLAAGLHGNTASYEACIAAVANCACLAIHNVVDFTLPSMQQSS